jgi:hypothetical protein
VKFLMYTHNLHMWPRAANMTCWAACWRSMSYVTLSLTVAPASMHARAHTHTHSKSFHIFKHQGNLLHFKGTLHNFRFMFHKLPFICFIFSVQIMHFLINNELKFKHQPSCLKVKFVFFYSTST